MFDENKPITLELGIEASMAVEEPAFMSAPKQLEAEYLQKTPLSAEEQKVVAAFCEKIDLKNSAIILQYGAACQKKVADFSDNVLQFLF